MIPTLKTERLTLSPFTLGDCDRVESLAGCSAVARTTLNIPHPYPAGASRLWIASHLTLFLKGEAVVLGIRRESVLIGCVSLGIAKSDTRAELGYWLGEDYWNQGYTTEAARACVDYGFRTLGLSKVTSRHFATNAPSGRVMEKIGMKKEGFLRRHIRKGEVLHDIVEYGVLREEWPNQ